jgi:tetratricopeptide (TPR) repeat protein
MIELLLQAERALSMGLVDQAERLYRQAIDADPRNSIAVVGLARVALERDDDVEAWRQARRALEIDPENAAARRLVDRLEEIWRHEGRPIPDPSAASVASPTSTAPAPAAAPVAPVAASGAGEETTIERPAASVDGAAPQESEAPGSPSLRAPAPGSTVVERSNDALAPPTPSPASTSVEPAATGNLGDTRPARAEPSPASMSVEPAATGDPGDTRSNRAEPPPGTEQPARERAHGPGLVDRLLRRNRA